MFPIWFTLAIVLLIFVAIALRRWLIAPIPYRKLQLVDTERFLKGFLQTHDFDSVFILEREGGPGFLQLALSYRDGDYEELEFGLPDVEWCRERFHLVHEEMQAAGHPCTVETNSGPKVIPRFLRVRIQGDRQELTPVLIAVLTLAASQLGFDSGDRYTLRMQGPFSPEYARELAEQLEPTERTNRFGRAVVAWARRSLKNHQRG